MRMKIVLLYESDNGRLLCDIASRVLMAISVAFGHNFVVSVRYTHAAEVEDAILDACAEADAVLLSADNMLSLPYTAFL